MADHARSDSPAVQAQLDRFAQLSPGRDILGLERITRLLALIGNPHHRLPPVFHIAGTNGKGSTCAFLRAMLEAAGLTVHVYASPHLVRFNERFRVAGKLIEDEALAPLLSDVLDAAEADDLGPSFFEATTAAAFLAFARTPADAVILEVGLGGRLDATNAIPAPLLCGIASLAIDHESFLLAPDVNVPDAPLDRIAFEKAGIAKASAPLVTQAYPPSMAATIAEQAARAGTHVVARGNAWDATADNGALHYQDALGALTLPLPTMQGAHQADNAALAVAMLRHQNALLVSPAAMAAGITAMHWPARMQLLAPGPLTTTAPNISEIWLDGGHNPDAASIIARHFEQDGARLGKAGIVLGMLANKDAAQFLAILAPITAALIAVPIEGHEHHNPDALADLAAKAGITTTGTAPDVASALALLNRSGLGYGTGTGSGTGTQRAAILGSLYLAGQVLAANNQVPS